VSARGQSFGRIFRYVDGLGSELARKNGWTLAEHAGEICPDGMQRLLRTADWDVEAVRDDIRDYLVQRLGTPEAVLVIDETGFIKKGKRLARWGVYPISDGRDQPHRGRDGHRPNPPGNSEAEHHGQHTGAPVGRPGGPGVRHQGRQAALTLSQHEVPRPAPEPSGDV